MSETPFISIRASHTFEGLIIGGIFFGWFFQFLNIGMPLGTIIGAVFGAIIGYRAGVYREKKHGEKKK